MNLKTVFIISFLQDIIEKAQPLSPRALIVDSIQTVNLKGVAGSAGGISQVPTPSRRSGLCPESKCQINRFNFLSMSKEREDLRWSCVGKMTEHLILEVKVCCLQAQSLNLKDCVYKFRIYYIV